MKKMKEQFRALTADAGFYIILLICLSVICISGYVLFFTGTGEDSGTAVLAAPAVGEPIFTIPPEDAVIREIPAEPTAEIPAEAAPVVPVVSEEQAEETAAQVPETIWIRPVAGEILRPFASDTLLYDETMGDWRTHEGVDYAAENGTRVYAISDGTVQSVTTDALYGTQVTLELRDGRFAIYRGLAEKVKVREGENVRAGDVIGTVGADADPSEAALGSHLHLAVMDGEQYVDPEAVLSGEARISSTDAAGEEEAVLRVDDSIPQDGIFAEE